MYNILVLFIPFLETIYDEYMTLKMGKKIKTVVPHHRDLSSAVSSWRLLHIPNQILDHCNHSAYHSQSLCLLVISWELLTTYLQRIYCNITRTILPIEHFHAQPFSGNVTANSYHSLLNVLFATTDHLVCSLLLTSTRSELRTNLSKLGLSLLLLLPMSRASNHAHRSRRTTKVFPQYFQLVKLTAPTFTEFSAEARITNIEWISPGDPLSYFSSR